jgi:hypothetical protein
MLKTSQKNLGVDGRNVEMDLKELLWKGVDWIHLAQDRDQWRALVNTVMNLRYHKVQGILVRAQQLPSSQEGACSMKLVVVSSTGFILNSFSCVANI